MFSRHRIRFGDCNATGTYSVVRSRRAEAVGLTALQRIFTKDDQAWFAARTGDWNPLHVDPVAARRTLFGRPVVHGVHVLCWAVDVALAGLEVGRRVLRLRASFEHPLPVGSPARIRFESEGDDRVKINVEADRPVARIEIALGTAGRDDGDLDGKLLAPAAPQVRDFASCAHAAGEIPILPLVADFAQSYGSLVALLGVRETAALLATTRLIGMECPGLHSIFGGLELTFGAAEVVPELRYRVERADQRFCLLTMSVAAMTMRGKIRAFLRPQPVAQPSFKNVRDVVVPHEFAGITALVIGGSRGLGEIVAKCLAAGGAAVTITYCHGEADAAAVAGDISAHGGRARHTHLDIDAASEHLAASLADAVPNAPNAVFYFAAPKIDLGHSDAFDSVLFMANARSFVAAPCALALAIAPLCADGALHFYPSTTFLDTPMVNGVEYRAAKAAGESAWQSLGLVFEAQRFVAPRLPRMQTDQTASLRPEAVDEPLPVLLAVLRACLPPTERWGDAAHG